jgi:hypothetical protein
VIYPVTGTAPPVGAPAPVTEPASMPAASPQTMPVAAETTAAPAAGMHPAPVQSVFIESPPDLDALVQAPPSGSLHLEASSILAGLLPAEGSGQETGVATDILPRKVRLQDGSLEESPSLNYTCLLLPRLPEHRLAGELAAGLEVWLPEMCLAFGWKSCQVVIEEQCLQVTVQVAPMVTPGSLVRVLRELTSQQIFAGFPDMAKQNGSGDFWAPGHLIISGVQSPTGRMVKEFIEKTRRRQGLQP